MSANNTGSDARFFVRWRGKVSGPVAYGKLVDQLKSGRISKHHQVSEDRSSWSNISDHEAFAEILSGGSSEMSGSRLQLRKDKEAKAAAEENYYYARDEEVIGPVAPAVIRKMIEGGTLPTETLVCKEGEDSWVEGGMFFGISSHEVPELPSEPTQHGDELDGAKICLQCGRIHRDESAFCKHCGAALGRPPTPSQNTNPPRRAYGGIGRLSYFGCSIAIGILTGVCQAMMATNDSFAVLYLIMLALSFVPVALRLQNIGMNGWMCLLMLVPLANAIVAAYCMVCPEGYNDHKQLDTPGKILLGLMIGGFVLGIIVVVLAVSYGMSL